MTVESENNEPNEFAFGGGGTGPQPDPERESAERSEGEDIAVPAGDLTGAASDCLDKMTQGDDSSR